MTVRQSESELERTLHERGSALPEAPARRPKHSPRFTTTPTTAPPQLLCPTCDRPLVYRHTVVSGVKPIERWDYFECRTCGPFVYRERTRKLRQAT